jgi:hypothetical protein
MATHCGPYSQDVPILTDDSFRVLLLLSKCLITQVGLKTVNEKGDTIN